MYVLIIKMDRSLLTEDKGYNKTIKSQGFSENQNEDHTDKDSVLLSISPDTSITYNTNG